jgi:WD40 repeat protein
MAMKKTHFVPLFFPLVFFLMTINLRAADVTLVVSTGNPNGVASVACSPDGRFALSASGSALKLWEIAGGLELRTFTPKSGSVMSVAFSPDGRFALGASDGVEMWDIATGKKVRIFSEDKFRYTSAGFSSDGKYVIAGQFFGEVYIWKADTGELVQSFKSVSDNMLNVYAVALSPDGAYAASGESDGKVKLWNTASGKLIYKLGGHSKGVWALTFSPDGRYILSGDKKKIKLWEVSTGKLVRTFGGLFTSQEFVTTLSFSQDGRYVLSANRKGEMIYWDCASGKALHVFEPQEGDAKKIWGSAAISPDGKYALHGRGGIIRLWSLADHRMVRELRGYSSTIQALAFAPKKDRLVLSALGDGRFKYWDLGTGREIQASQSENGFQGPVSFSPDGKTLFYLNKNGLPVLADATNGSTIRTFQTKSRAAAMSPDGRFILTLDQRSGILWDAHNGEKRNILKGDDTFLTAVAFTPDSRFAVTGGEGKIKIWDTASGRNVRDLDPGEPTGPFSSIAVSRNNRFVLAGALFDPKLFLWDLSSGELLRVLAGHRKGVLSVAFSPDGSRALSSGYLEKAVNLWDVASGKLLKTFSGHSSDATCVAFSPDGRYGLSGAYDGVVKIYDIVRQSTLGSKVHINEKDWVFYSGDGRFDGTPEGIRHLHFVRELETFPLEAFYENFYTPNLAAILQTEKPQATVPVDISREISEPPMVEILSPKQGDRVTARKITIKAKISDQGSGIDEIRLYQNGKLVSEATRGIVIIAKTHREATHSFDVFLTPGTNSFRLIALNRNRTESKPAILNVDFTDRSSSATANLYILAIGINQYKNSIYNLNFGRHDAESFCNALVNKAKDIFRTIHKKEIYDDAAVKPVIENEIKRIVSEAGPEDVFVFYYAGHGVMSTDTEGSRADFFLVLHDVTQLYGRDDLLREKGISSAQLKEWFKMIPAQKQLVIIDACQAGGAVETFARRGAAEQKAIAQLARSTGIIVLASSGTEQYASEFQELGHGLFTYALLQAIAGNADGGNPPDGKITVKEMESYINDQVPELSHHYRGSTQYPTSYAVGNDFPLAVK